MRFLRSETVQLQNSQVACKASKDRKHNNHTNSHKTYRFDSLSKQN